LDFIKRGFGEFFSALDTKRGFIRIFGAAINAKFCENQNGNKKNEDKKDKYFFCF
jgi:hypothetical protein